MEDGALDNGLLLVYSHKTKRTRLVVSSGIVEKFDMAAAGSC